MSSNIVVTKPIKPTAFQHEKMNLVLKRAMEQTAKDILFDYEATAWNWKHKVKFKKVLAVGPNSLDVLVGTDDEIYGYVDQGTHIHDIVPKRKGGYLAFKVGGSPKTQPGVMVSGSGQPGTVQVFAKKVRVKTRARRFSKTIQKEWDKKFKNRMEKAMNEAVKVSGHAYK
jgi:hypothetical protein